MRAEMGGVAAPPGLSARRLAGFYRLLCAQAAQKSHQGGSGWRDCCRRLAALCPLPRRGDNSSDRLPRGSVTACAPRLNIMYRIA